MFLRFLARHREGVFALAAFVVALAMMTGNWGEQSEQGLLEEGVMAAAGPVLSAASVLGGLPGRIGDYILGSRGLREENRLLRDEVIRLRRDLDMVEEKEQAYRRLSSILDFKRETGFPLKVAAVIGRDSTALFQTIILNKGYLDGIGKDMAVVTPEGAVGRTTKVFARSATVLLVTDLSSGVDALVQRTRDQGVVRGTGRGECEMKYLSRQAEVEEGDLIVTSGMEGIFPKGVSLGRVTRVKRGGYLLQNVEVHPSAHLDRLEEVAVIVEEGGGP